MTDASTQPLGLSDALLHGYVGKFLRETESVKSLLKDLALDLPQIVVVGQESSGKSSVLEALAMMPLFPRDEQICTRLPIHLKMRHRERTNSTDSASAASSSEGEQQPQDEPVSAIRMRLLFSDGRPPVVSADGFGADEVAQLMRQWMDGIVAAENPASLAKGVVDHVLEIEVTSPLVPNLDLVDLPGIVAGRIPGEPDDMMQRTRALVEKYLEMPHTLVLAVVPAFERVRNSQAFQLVQQYQLTDSAIGVLTMVDRAMDPSNPRGPLADVMERLEGKAGDLVHLDQGYVAVKSRDTRVPPDQQLSLDVFQRHEKEWLNEHLPGYVERGLASSGALAVKLERMLAEHVRHKWVAQAIAKLLAKREELQASLSELGCDPQEIVTLMLESSEAAQRVGAIQELVGRSVTLTIETVERELLELASLICRAALDELQRESVLIGASAARSATWLAVVQDKIAAYVSSHTEAIVGAVYLRIAHTLRCHLAGDTSSTFNVPRFGRLHLWLAMAMRRARTELVAPIDHLRDEMTATMLLPSTGAPVGATGRRVSGEVTLEETLAAIVPFDDAFVAWAPPVDTAASASTSKPPDAEPLDLPFDKLDEGRAKEFQQHATDCQLCERADCMEMWRLRSHAQEHASAADCTDCNALRAWESFVSSGVLPDDSVDGEPSQRSPPGGLSFASPVASTTPQPSTAFMFGPAAAPPSGATTAPPTPKFTFGSGATTAPPTPKFSFGSGTTPSNSKTAPSTETGNAKASPQPRAQPAPPVKTPEKPVRSEPPTLRELVARSTTSSRVVRHWGASMLGQIAASIVDHALTCTVPRSLCGSLCGPLRSILAAPSYVKTADVRATALTVALQESRAQLNRAVGAAATKLTHLLTHSHSCKGERALLGGKAAPCTVDYCHEARAVLQLHSLCRQVSNCGHCEQASALGFAFVHDEAAAALKQHLPPAILNELLGDTGVTDGAGCRWLDRYRQRCETQLARALSRHIAAPLLRRGVVNLQHLEEELVAYLKTHPTVGDDSTHWLAERHRAERLALVHKLERLDHAIEGLLQLSETTA
ncbi:hypothetical protein ATCC90586_002156 [Pythium insidiosum]|nr:hypothetical protein ATCC90586_002156 [Pythium insidiosum]